MNQSNGPHKLSYLSTSTYRGRKIHPFVYVALICAVVEPFWMYSNIPLKIFRALGGGPFESNVLAAGIPGASLILGCLAILRIRRNPEAYLGIGLSILAISISTFWVAGLVVLNNIR